MYLYYTGKDYETLPSSGWLFPCIHCKTITSKYDFKIIDVLWGRNQNIYIPICNKCLKKNKGNEYDLDSNNFKYILN